MAPTGLPATAAPSPAASTSPLLYLLPFHYHAYHAYQDDPGTRVRLSPLAATVERGGTQQEEKAMAWRYECSDCDRRTTWMGRADAEDARYRHHDRAHRGKTPAKEQLITNAERVVDNPRQLAFVLMIALLAVLVWAFNAIT
jgi:hypothetical protein